MKAFQITTWRGITSVTMTSATYANNKHISLQLWCEDGPYVTMTVNLPETRKYPKNFAFLDTNNFYAGPDIVKKLGIGKYAGVIARSGFCTYPLYEFFPEKIAEYTGKEVK